MSTSTNTSAKAATCASPAAPTTRELLRWLTSHTQPVHKPLYVSAFLRVVNLSLDILLFGCAGAAVMAVLTEGRASGPYLASLVAIALAKAAAYYCEQLSGHYVAFKALELLRTLVFSELWPKAPAIVAGSRSGDVLTSLTRDVDRIEVVYAHTFAPVVSAVVVPPAFVIGAGIVCGWDTVAVPAVCVLLALLAVPFLGTRGLMRATRHTLAVRRDLAHHVTDSVFGAEEVVGYGKVSQRLQEMDQLGQEVAVSAGKARRANAMRRGANLGLMLASVAGVAYASAGAGHSVVLTATLTAATMRLFEGPRGVEDAAGYLDHSFAAARRLWEICHVPAAVEDGPEVLELTEAPAVRFDSLSYTYPGSSAPVLRNVSVEIHGGGHLVLVGPSGSGKSTLVNMLMRYDDPNDGGVALNGQPVARYTLDSLRCNVAVVSQKNQLLDATIAENLRLGVPEASEDELWAALRAAHLADDVRQMPLGLATAVGQAGRELSGGQAQRLCLARALLMKPKVLVLDEFTANLNVELEAAIRREIEAMDATIIEITHRLDSSLHADRFVVIDGGAAVAQASRAEIDGSGNSLREFFARSISVN